MLGNSVDFLNGVAGNARIQRSMFKSQGVRVFGLAGWMAMAAGAGWAQASGTPAAKAGVAKPSQAGTALDTPSAQAVSDAAGKGAETPLDSSVPQPNGDASALSSPVAAGANGASIRVGTEVQMILSQAVDSGSKRNGDSVQGVLAAPLRTSAGAVLPKGTVVMGTVVSSAKAGEVVSGGVLSLQLTRVGAVHVITDVLDFNGKEGHKDVADAAPEKGTEAAVASGSVLRFKVMEQGRATGLVPGVAPANVGANTPGAGQPAGTDSRNTGPGVNQTQIHGATQGVVPLGSTPK